MDKKLSVIDGSVPDDENLDDLVLSGELSEGDINFIKKHNDTLYLKSRFGFLQKQEGLRPMCLHVLLGTAGSGKSTLTRSIILDVAKEEKVLIWLTEESKTDFLLGYTKLPGARDTLKNLIFIEEENLGAKYLDTWEGCGSIVRHAVTQHNPALFVLDNITTGIIYETRPLTEHNEFIRYLKFYTKKMQIATLVIAHTGKGVVDANKRFIGLGDIKGSSALENKAEYFYVYQRIAIADQFYPILRVLKSRYHQNNSTYLLNYNKFTAGYDSDKEVSYTQLEAWFKDANKR